MELSTGSVFTSNYTEIRNGAKGILNTKNQSIWQQKHHSKTSNSKICRKFHHRTQ